MRELRRRDERGVTAIIVALMITALTGSAAISVDYGHAVYEKRRVQKAADAGARAVATDCALAPGSSTCSQSTANATVDSLVVSNANSSTSAPTKSLVKGIDTGTITVQTQQTVPYSFARVFGINSKTVTGRSVASWAYDTQQPTEGFPVLPIGISYCTFKNNSSYLTTGAASSSSMLLRTDTLQAVSSAVATVPIVGGLLTPLVNLLTGTKETCTNGAGESVSMLSGAVWLSGVQSTISGIFDFLPSQCKLRMSSDANVKLGSLTNGVVIPDGCVAKLNGLAGKTVLLPVYLPRDNLNVLGLSVTGCVLGLNCVTALSAKIVGYVPFKISAYKFGTVVSSPAPPGCSSIDISLKVLSLLSPNLSIGCNGLQGTFVRTMTHDPDFTFGPSSPTSEFLKLFIKVRLQE